MTSMSVDATFVIPAYGNLAVTRECVESLRRRQEDRPRLAERYADVLEPRKPREAVRRFMQVGQWN